MVDLHQTLPAFPEGHPWPELGRWGMAWRAAFAVLAATMLGLLAMSAADQHGSTGFLGGTGWVTLGIVPALAGALTLWLGPWLRRYYPFSQGLIFGAIAAAGVALLIVALTAVDAVVTGSGSALVLLLFLSPPVFLACAVAYPMAIWSTTTAGAKVCWPILGLAIAGYTTAAVLTHSG